MKIHLLDGTYELYRAHFGMPPSTAPDGRLVSAVRGIMQSFLSLLRVDDVTHVACAFDHKIESFRNQMFDGYKTGEGAPVELLAQFGLAERAVAAMGIVVWPMVEFEADDALATAAARWADDDRVEQVVICSPDKDLCQMVSGQRVVCLDRRRNIVLDSDGVVEKFGVKPESIPDYLALVGDSADGIPGVARWGAKGASTVLSQFNHIEDIPADPAEWDPAPRGAKGLAANLSAAQEDVALYKELATLRTDVPISESLDDLKWIGANEDEYTSLCLELGFGGISNAPTRWISNQ
ncbi:MAG: 5'-3' exonuclease H3TH domain-containing protein [SAR202 cluster bacterium]|jgi:5'-3' exonuclease|nr:5'-3' exonuclease H3TH domain-containing protein [SAR202 cluster bacterium]MDP6514451.1 5'-3' exonuclease H3TH domain-containing protein [SAR202 cluster bacterium]MDP6716168.1 5'-3' exonuclease H3TH domain-containing protein [SAR202 cluster bacterium]